MSTSPQTETNFTQAPPAPLPAKADPLRTDEEVDVWWGSYSGWAMLPSLGVCIALTGLIAWFTWATFYGGRSGFVQLTFLSLAGGVWLLQTIRWAYRSCAYNYRLTTRRLFRDTGFGAKRRRVIDLQTIADVYVRAASHEKLVGVGRIIITFQNTSHRKLVLDGVRQPQNVAELIRAYAKKAS